MSARIDAARFAVLAYSERTGLAYPEEAAGALAADLLRMQVGDPSPSNQGAAARALHDALVDWRKEPA